MKTYYKHSNVNKYYDSIFFLDNSWCSYLKSILIKSPPVGGVSKKIDLGFILKDQMFFMKLLLAGPYRSCPLKKGFLKNSQKDTCVKVFFFDKKRLRDRRFPENFAKFLSISTLKNTYERLLLNIPKANHWITIKYIPWVKNCLSRPITSNFLKAVFHKFHLVHSWILCPIWCDCWGVM